MRLPEIECKDEGYKKLVIKALLKVIPEYEKVNQPSKSLPEKLRPLKVYFTERKFCDFSLPIPSSFSDIGGTLGQVNSTKWKRKIRMLIFINRIKKVENGEVSGSLCPLAKVNNWAVLLHEVVHYLQHQHKSIRTEDEANYIANKIINEEGYENRKID